MPYILIIFSLTDSYGLIRIKRYLCVVATSVNSSKPEIFGEYDAVYCLRVAKKRYGYK